MTTPGEAAILTVERHGHVAVVRHDHPPRNFMTARMLRELRVRLRALEADPSVRVIVLTGRREGHYLLHLEVAEIQAMLAQTPRLPAPLMRLALWSLRALVALLRVWPWLADRLLPARPTRRMSRLALLDVLLLFDAVERSSKVTIAAINGPCVGGGMELSLCFDHRLAIDDPAHVLGLPEILIGMMPGFGGTQRLMRLCGASRARSLLLSGEVLTPRAAATLGLVEGALPRETFTADVLAFAERAARRAPASVRGIKRALRRGAGVSLGRGLAIELEELAPLARAAETRRGLAAYRAELDRLLALPEAEQPGAAELVRALDAGAPHPARSSAPPLRPRQVA